MNSKDSLQEISLRIKYESFAKLSTELSNAQSFQDVAMVLQTNLKYIFNFTAFRIVVFDELERLQFEVTRKSSVVMRDDIAILPIAAEVIRTNITTVLNEKQLIEHQQDIYPLFHPPQIKNLCLYPIRANENQYMVIGAGNKEDRAPIDSDYRLLRLVGESLLSKLSQLILKDQLERLVQKRTAQLNLANQELSTLFYRASHDFNAPLTTLLGLAQLGRMQLNKPEEIIALIDRSAVVIRQAQNMLKKFKVISEAEVQETSIDQINLSSFLQQQIDQFIFKAREKGIHLDYTSTGEEQIHFSKDILIALLENLIENAIQFHRHNEDSFIHIEAHATISQLTIHVIDNGLGIAKDQHTSIFHLYTRGHESSKGNGLGLYLVKRIVEKMKGSVVVESELNAGSQFTVSLPLTTIK